MTDISKEQHDELIHILEQVIEVIEIMRQEDKCYFLFLNWREACDWLKFLKGHTDKEELESLGIEVAERFVFKFANSANDTELDIERMELIEKFSYKLNEYVQK